MTDPARRQRGTSIHQWGEVARPPNEVRNAAEAAPKEKTAMTLVCAWCDVYCRVERVHTDAAGEVIMHDTVCAYCGRSELRFSKLGRQTPIPKDDAAPDRIPF